MNLIFLGPPGAGKGTQADNFRRRHGLPHISTGSMLRAAVAEGTDVGRLAQEYMQRGDLVPDKVVEAIVRIRLSEPDCDAGFILDGYPRTIPQADDLEAFLASANRHLDAVVYFEVREEILLRRLTGRRICPVCGTTYHVDANPPKVEGRCDLDGAQLIQRPDDAPDKVRHRLEVFRQWTYPLIDYYRKHGVFLTVNGEGSVEDVYARIRDFATARAMQER
jgi:adenylate kinase